MCFRYTRQTIYKELFGHCLPALRADAPARETEGEYPVLPYGADAQENVEETGQRVYREAFWIREYLHLERYDKRVMASLIESAKVLGEDRLEVVWEFGDIFEKILGEMQ